MMSIRSSEFCVESFIRTNHILPSLSSDNKMRGRFCCVFFWEIFERFSVKVDSLSLPCFNPILLDSVRSISLNKAEILIEAKEMN
jgi:hypothetical protein